MLNCRNHLHEEQGCFGQTYVIKLEDQSKVIVQFRDTPLELARRTSLLYRQNMHLFPELVCREIGSPGSNY